jgi:hypothetical protein
MGIALYSKMKVDINSYDEFSFCSYFLLLLLTEKVCFLFLAFVI